MLEYFAVFGWMTMVVIAGYYMLDINNRFNTNIDDTMDVTISFLTRVMLLVLAFSLPLCYYTQCTRDAKKNTIQQRVVTEINCNVMQDVCEYKLDDGFIFKTNVMDFSDGKFKIGDTLYTTRLSQSRKD